MLKTAKSNFRISSLYWLKSVLGKKVSDLKVGTLAGVLAGFFSRNQLGYSIQSANTKGSVGT